MGTVITPINDQKVFDTPDDEQLAIGDEAEIAGPKPRSCGCAIRRTDQHAPESLLSLLRFAPIAFSDVSAVSPYLPRRPRRTLGTGLGIHDPHHRRFRHAVAD